MSAMQVTSTSLIDILDRIIYISLSSVRRVNRAQFAGSHNAQAIEQIRREGWGPWMLAMLAHGYGRALDDGAWIWLHPE